MEPLNNVILDLGLDPFFTGLVLGVVLTLLVKISSSGAQPVHKEVVPLDRASLDPGVLAEIEHLIRQGQTIAAIQKLREATGMGLRAAKEQVEAMSRRGPA